MTFSGKYLFMLLLSAAFFVACGNGVEGEVVEAGEAIETAEQDVQNAVTYVVNTEASNIKWEGAKFTGDTHQGTISVQDGELMVTGDQITAGRFIIDMQTINVTDLEAGSGKEKLEGHLKNDDFFSVDTYPTATFELVSLEPATGTEGATHMITGNLTMKDQTRSITFPANVSVSGNQLTATSPAFVIDRTQWGVAYGSNSVAGIAKDKAIKDEIGLQLDVRASAQQATK